MQFYLIFFIYKFMNNKKISLFKGYSDICPNPVTLADIVGLIR